MALAIAGTGSCDRSERGSESVTSVVGAGSASADVEDDAAGFERAPLDGYRALALTSSGGCALHETGRLACWGKDVLWQGQGYVASPEPRFLPGLSQVARLVGGGGLCATTTQEHTWCWGLGAWGTSPGTFSFGPMRVPDLDGLRVTLAWPLDGQHACGIAADGALSCWGRNGCGQAGQSSGVGDFAAYLRPAVVLRAVRLVALGSRLTCAVDDRGALSCWGDAEGGALGDGDAHERECEWYTPEGTPGGPPPTQARRCKGPDPYVSAPVVVSQGPVTAIAAGWRSACSVDDGEVRCWGDRFGVKPTVIPVSNVVELAAAGSMYCGRSSSGEVSCWGAATDAKLLSLAPRSIEPLAGATTITVAPLRVCGLVRTTVRCWGRNASGLSIDDFTSAGPHP